jgi:hypothetical protein
VLRVDFDELDGLELECINFELVDAALEILEDDL